MSRIKFNSHNESQTFSVGSGEKCYFWLLDCGQKSVIVCDHADGCSGFSQTGTAPTFDTIEQAEEFLEIALSIGGVPEPNDLR